MASNDEPSVRSDRVDRRLLRQIQLSSGDPDARLHLPHHEGRPRVLVRFTGDRADLEAAGMLVESVIGDVATGHVALEDVGTLARVPHVVFVEASGYVRPHLHDSVPAIHASHSQLEQVGLGGLTGAGVVVGIVDSGVDIFHHAFRRPNGSSRIIEVWDQAWTPTADPDPPLDSRDQPVQPVPAPPVTDPPGTPAATRYPGTNFNYGKIYDASDIAQALHRWETEDPKPTNLPKVLMPRERGENDHGTHVAGIAAGNGAQSGATSDVASCHSAGYYMGVAPEADLVVVRASGVGDQEATAASFVFFKAGSQPAVVNYSRGMNSFETTRDGSSLVERLWDNLLVPTPGSGPGTELPGRVVVASAGNLGRGDNFIDGNDTGWGVNQVRVAVPAGGQAVCAFEVPAEDVNDDLLGLSYDLPAGPPAEVIRLTLTPPGGTAYAQVPLNASWSTPLTGGPAGGDIVKAHSGTDATARRGFLDFTISPRVPPAPSTPPPASAPPPPKPPLTSGVWLMTLANTSTTEVPVVLWIDNEQSDPAPHFVDDFAGRPATNPPIVIWTRSTVTSPSTADNLICVADLDTTQSPWKISDHSSRGPRIDQPRNQLYGVSKPDFSAPGTAIVSARSSFERETACSDCCLAAYKTMGGTSMAAPHVTGVVALMLQRNPAMAFPEVRRLLREHCDDPPAGAMDPNFVWEDVWGAGVVNAVRTLAYVSVPPGMTDPLIPSEVAAVGATVPPPDPDISPAYAMTADPGWAERLNRLDRLFGNLPVWQDLQALVSTHFDEVYRLINTNPRVATMWHRIGGPALVRRVFATTEPDRIVLPEVHDGRPIATALKRWLAMLTEFGSPGLRSDVSAYGPAVLALPGTTFSAATPGATVMGEAR